MLKEAPPEVRLNPLDTNPVSQCLRDVIDVVLVSLSLTLNRFHYIALDFPLLTFSKIDVICH